MAEQWQFIFAVFCMYAFIFMIYTLSGGAIYGLDSANAFEDIATSGVETGGFTDWLTGGIGTLVGFFTVLFVPINEFWWMTMINWAVIGTTTYIFLKLIRGGG